MFRNIICKLFGHLFKFNTPEQNELTLTCVRCGYVETLYAGSSKPAEEVE